MTAHSPLTLSAGLLLVTLAVAAPTAQAPRGAPPPLPEGPGKAWSSPPAPSVTA